MKYSNPNLTKQTKHDLSKQNHTLKFGLEMILNVIMEMVDGNRCHTFASLENV